jgi:succinyldiaminopimelate transaminase
MAGFVLPPYPYARLDALKQQATLAPGGIVDLSVGTPCDPVPASVTAALAEAAPRWAGYPTAIGAAPLREAVCDWMERRLGVSADPGHVVACIGTKELVASLPGVLRLKDPSRDTVLYPAVSYPTYEMGALLSGCRAVPVPLTEDGWHLDLTRVAEEDAARALLLWLNEPGNPTGSAAGPDELAAAVAWARARGIVVASDECYVEFTWDHAGRPVPGSTALATGADGVLVVHSLSKRSNMAGYRSGFVAGDGDLVSYLGQVRTHSGMMVPGPIQVAATAAWADDAHVEEQRAVYAERIALVKDALPGAGLIDAGGPGTFYLWVRDEHGASGWEVAARLAATGTLVAAGDLYGAGGAGYVRIALVQPTERLDLAFDRLGRSATGGTPPTPSSTSA